MVSILALIASLIVGDLHWTQLDPDSQAEVCAAHFEGDASVPDYVADACNDLAEEGY
jgi:hypothetical protein